MCDPITGSVVAGTVLTTGAQLSAAEDAEDRYHQQSQISMANAEHQREVAIYNASIYQDQALLVLNEQLQCALHVLDQTYRETIQSFSYY